MHFEALTQSPGLLCAMHKNYAMHFTFTWKSVLDRDPSLPRLLLSRCCSFSSNTPRATRCSDAQTWKMWAPACLRFWKQWQTLHTLGNWYSWRLFPLSRPVRMLWTTSTAFQKVGHVWCSGEDHSYCSWHVLSYACMLMVQFRRGDMVCMWWWVLLFICFHRVLKLSGVWNNIVRSEEASDHPEPICGL